ncbi:hypothetical protein Taro_005581 [Colocasia esculenta]|uniref:Uncharacterized protein n=1 Tax=Colocasia esculenta TaxID=4460 RepID=A0A843TQA5_COLES|nr:hypothetical protein [Colocasia esculenta]
MDEPTSTSLVRWIFLVLDEELKQSSRERAFFLVLARVLALDSYRHLLQSSGFQNHDVAGKHYLSTGLSVCLAFSSVGADLYHQQLSCSCVSVSFAPSGYALDFGPIARGGLGYGALLGINIRGRYNWKFSYGNVIVFEKLAVENVNKVEAE